MEPWIILLVLGDADRARRFYRDPDIRIAPSQEFLSDVLWVERYTVEETKRA
jgi:hypothetical protein